MGAGGDSTDRSGGVPGGMKQILIDRTELLGRIIAIESGCLDVKSRSVIQQIKETILRLPTKEQKGDADHG